MIKTASDRGLFARASAYYDDSTLCTLTLAIGHFYLFIPVAHIGKPIPGSPWEEPQQTRPRGTVNAHVS